MPSSNCPSSVFSNARHNSRLLSSFSRLHKYKRNQNYIYFQRSTCDEYMHAGPEWVGAVSKRCDDLIKIVVLFAQRYLFVFYCKKLKTKLLLISIKNNGWLINYVACMRMCDCVQEFVHDSGSPLEFTSGECQDLQNIYRMLTKCVTTEPPIM